MCSIICLREVSHKWKPVFATPVVFPLMGAWNAGEIWQGKRHRQMRKKIKVEAEMVVVLIAMFLLGSSIELANCKYMGWSLKVTQEMAFQLSWLDTGLLSLVSFLDRHWEPNLKPLNEE
ncbi:hypothetical protein ACS0TY_021148 [Phlomoides rotata]